MVDVYLMGGTAGSCSLFCAECRHLFMSDSGEWDEDPADPDVYKIDALELARLISEHRCPEEASP